MPQLSLAENHRISPRQTVSKLAAVLILAATAALGRGGILPASRATASTFTVTKTADTNDGVCNADCSLREAMTAANASPGADTITFAIPGGGPHVITVSSDLPIISDVATIDGTTQGCGVTPCVVIQPTTPATGTGLQFAADGSVVNDLAVEAFDTGIDVSANGVQIIANEISGNAGAGVNISSGGSASIGSNLIGTNLSGTAASANAEGVVVATGSSGSNLIGGNVISGNLNEGIMVNAGVGQGETIFSNYIGTDATGAVDLANGGDGAIVIASDGAVMGSNVSLTSTRLRSRTSIR